MSTIQRLAKKLLPKQTADAMEAESREWRVVCAGGHDRSIWDLGGIRYKAADNPRKLMKCPACGKRTWHSVFKQPAGEVAAARLPKLSQPHINPRMNNTTALDRRSFLQLGSAAVVAASLSACQTSRQAGGRKIKKAIMWSTIGVKGTVMEKMKAAQTAGFLGVEPMGGMSREDVVAALKETGLKAASVCCHTHWAKPLSAPDEATRKVGYDGLVLSLQDAKAYSATSVLLVPGVVNDKVTYDDCFKRCVAEIKKTVPVAKDLGVKIAIENVWNNFVTQPQQAVDLLDAINSEWVGWHFDIGNVGRYSPAETWIPLLGKRILKLHIKEFDTRKMTAASPGAGFGAKFLEGDNNWPAIMAALDKIGYTGWGIAEQGGGGTPEGLKDLSDRMTKIFAS